jgi:hypothetical protein
MIKELTELVTLAEQSLPGAEELLRFYSRGNRDVEKLYYAIQSASYRTEADAVQRIGIGERTKFRQVARELFRCLELMALHLDSERQLSDPLNSSRLRGFRLTAIAKSLSPLACKHAARKTAEELLKLGQDYGRPEFVVEASRILMDYVSVAGDDLKTYDRYLELYEQYSEWRMVEEKAVICFDRIKLPSVKRKTLQKELAEQAQRYLNDLESYAGVINSHNFHVSYYSLLSYRHTMEGRYQEASAVHEAAITWFSERPYPCNQALNIFHYLEIMNCFYLGSYSRGNRFFSRALDLASPGTYNWFSTIELGFYLKMYQGEYRQAAEIYQMAVKNRKMAVLREAQRETWHILGAYLFIVQQLTGKQIPEEMAPKVKSTRFRNDIRDFSQDKQGMNVAILAAEVLLEYVEGKFDSLWDRIAALEKYRERYLRNSGETHRSQLFIKILVILSKYNYDSEKFPEKVRPYLEELRKAPLQLSNQSHELEIIPYEALVRLLTDSMRARRTRTVGGKDNRLPGFRG